MKNLFKIVILCLIYLSCNIADIEDYSSKIKSFPDTDNQVLGPSDEIYVNFNFDVDHDSAESILSVSSFNLSVSGKYEWENTTVYFIPEEELFPGYRYTLECTGQVKKTNGVYYDVNIIVPFFYLSNEENKPYISSIEPDNGTTINIDQEIIIDFTKPISTTSLEEGLSINPSIEYSAVWENNNSRLRISPEEEWENLTIYEFAFDDDLLDSSDIPLGLEKSFYFLVQYDLELPQVENVQRALNNWELDFPFVDDDLNNLTNNDVIRITFTESMEKETTENSVSFVPDISGTFVWLENDSVLIFIPDSGYSFDTDYALNISKSAEDSSGNNLLEDYIIEDFRPNLQELVLDTLSGDSSDNTSFTNNFNNEDPIIISLSGTPGDESQYLFHLGFSENIPDENKLQAQNAVSIESLVPPWSSNDHGNPIMILAHWSSDSTLDITFDGFEESTADTLFYYYLKIKAGSGGVLTEDGEYLLEDFQQLLRTNL